MNKKKTVISFSREIFTYTFCGTCSKISIKLSFVDESQINKTLWFIFWSSFILVQLINIFQDRKYAESNSTLLGMDYQSLCAIAMYFLASWLNFIHKERYLGIQVWWYSVLKVKYLQYLETCPPVFGLADCSWDRQNWRALTYDILKKKLLQKIYELKFLWTWNKWRLVNHTEHILNSVTLWRYRIVLCWNSGL